MIGQRLTALGTVTCAAILEQRHPPVGVAILGELLPAIGYGRVRPNHLDLSCVSAPDQAFLQGVFSDLDGVAIARHLLAINRASVVGQGTVVLPDGRILLDSAAEFMNHGLAPQGMTDCGGGRFRSDSPVSQDLPGTSLLVKRPWYRNYGHWLIDLSSLIALVSRTGTRIDRVIYGDVGPGLFRDAMQEVAERHAPSAEVSYLADDITVCCERLLYVQPVHVPPLYKHPLAMECVRQLLDGLRPTEPSWGRRLFVSRRDTATRRIVNEDELETWLAAMGFETIYPGAMSLGDQVEAFAAASIVIGPKGAGLTNVLCCIPGSQVIVLSPQGFTDPFFWDLLTPLGIGYAEIFCPAATSAASVAAVDIRVDLAAVRRAFQALSIAAPSGA